MPNNPTEQYPVVSKPYAAEYVTPNLRDFFAFIRVDRKKPDYAEPAVGSPYPPTGNEELDAKFAGFKFAVIEPDKSGDEFVFWIYVRDRAGEDQWNYEISYPYGSELYPSYTRTYVILRSAYAQPALGTADPVIAGAVLVMPDKVMRSNNKVIDSLYVSVQRRFDVVPDITANLSDLVLYGFKVSFPYGDFNFPNVVWKTKVRGYSAVQELSAACPIPGYTTLTIIGQEVADEEKGGWVDVTLTYEIVPGPILMESDYEPRLEAPIFITKQIIPTSSVPADAAALLAAQLLLPKGVVDEYKNFGDKLRSIQIVSKLDLNADYLNGFPDIVYQGTVNDSFPNEILVAPQLFLVWALSGDGHMRLDIAPTVRVHYGYQGPCTAIIVERRTFQPLSDAFLNGFTGLSGPMPGLETATVIQPQADLVQFAVTYFDAINAIADAKAHPIPESLHPGHIINWVIPGLTPGGFGYLPTVLAGYAMNQTTPSTMLDETLYKASTNYPHYPYDLGRTGVWRLKSIEPEKWRFSLWIFRIIYTLVPGTS